MIPTARNETHVVFSSEADIKATIELSNMGAVLDTLSNMYSDPIYAILREYSTNALDSHVAAGNLRPIEVTLPDVNGVGTHGLFLKIQDYGVGLNLDDLKRTYLSYGASTKRESNDFNGTLGIGSKSGLTYSPLGFQVTAIKDGVKILAVIAKDADGIGVMRILDTSETDEGNGVTVRFEVDEDDAGAFHSSAEKLFKAWRPGTVLVDRQDGEGFQQPLNHHDDENLIWLDDDVAIGRKIQSQVIMGSVPYRVERRSAWGYGVIAFVEMGLVDFTPSREDLKYTDPEVTEATLDALFTYVDTRAEEVVIEYVKNEASPWLRLKAAADLKSALDPSRKRRMDRLVRPYLPADPFNFEGKVAYRWDPERRNSVTSFQSMHYSTIENADNTIVVTGFPFQPKTLSPTHRDRLRRFRAEVGVSGYYDNRATFVLLPKRGWSNDPMERDFEIEMLEGRPNVYTWDEVVARTPTPPRQPGEKKPKTTYKVWHQGRTVAQEKVDPAIGPVLYCGFNSEPVYARRYPEAQIVGLRSNQEDRFRRLHPFAATVYEYDRLQKKEAVARLSKRDRLRLLAPSDYDWVEGVKDSIEDPIFEEARQALTAEMSREEARVRYLDQEQAVKAQDGDDLWSTLEERYPLLRLMKRAWLHDGEAEEMVLYVNAKHQQMVGAAEIERLLASVQDGEDASVDSSEADVDSAYAD